MFFLCFISITMMLSCQVLGYVDGNSFFFCHFNTSMQVVNCVGGKNYKYFVLFVFWGFLGCFSYAVCVAEHIFFGFSVVSLSLIFPPRVYIKFLFQDPAKNFAPNFTLLFSGFFPFTYPVRFRVDCVSRNSDNRICLLPFDVLALSHEARVFQRHHARVWRTRSTSIWSSFFLLPILDLIGQANKYDLGRRRNFEAVFGSDPWTWLLPVPANVAGNGFVFETNGAAALFGVGAGSAGAMASSSSSSIQAKGGKGERDLSDEQMVPLTHDVPVDVRLLIESKDEK